MFDNSPCIRYRYGNMTMCNVYYINKLLNKKTFLRLASLSLYPFLSFCMCIHYSEPIRYIKQYINRYLDTTIFYLCILNLLYIKVKITFDKQKYLFKLNKCDDRRKKNIKCNNAITQFRSVRIDNQLVENNFKYFSSENIVTLCMNNSLTRVKP